MEVKIETGKKKRILKGEEAEIALKAMEYILDNLKYPKKIKIDIIVPEMPENFSFAKTISEALEKGLKNPVDIADFTIKKIERAKKSF